ncbi:MAG: AraC family transcriptional regulator [Bacillota bacterium]|nr:MAG: AraC family transcriptional regulator [Bacillota bacterium]
MNGITFAGKQLKTFNVLAHAHEDWELIYCTGGAGEILWQNEKTAYTEGDALVIPPHLLHCNYSNKGFTNVHIRIENDCTLVADGVTKVSDDADRHIRTCFEAAFFHFNGDADKRAVLLSAYGNLIVSYLAAFRGRSVLSAVTEKIKADIVKNFPSADYKLDAFLHSLPFNYDYLRKLFKRETGITPHEYLTAMRMQTAEKLLSCDTPYNVSEIAALCGFDEPLYFSRIFKKTHGVSPLHYAKRLR